MNFRATACSSCHKDIQIPRDVSTPVCPYCGTLQAFENTAPAATVATLLGMARTALGAGNQSEALNYFNRVLESDPSCSDAWMGKGKAAGWLSNLSNIRLPEMIIAFNHAIATAPQDQRASTIRIAVTEANRLSAALYKLARQHVVEYVGLPKTYSTYLVQTSKVLDALEEVSKWLPSERTTLENIIHLCKDNIEGISYRDRFDNDTPKVQMVTPEYEALLRARLDSATVRLIKLDPTYFPPAIERKKAAACFVITATMGDANHPTVTLMREFRDEWMLKTWWGPSFVGLYYRYGPALATVIGATPLLRTASYFVIVLPSAWLARRVLYV